MSDKVATLDFEKFHNTIAGKSRDSPKVHNGVNPSDKTKLWDVPIAAEHDLDDAVKSAQEAFKRWSKTAWKERQSLLLRLREELLSHRVEMAQMILKECGKPVCRIYHLVNKTFMLNLNKIQFAQGEIDGAAGILQYHGRFIV